MLCVIHPATDKDKVYLYPDRTPWKYKSACELVVGIKFNDATNYPMNCNERVIYDAPSEVSNDVIPTYSALMDYITHTMMPTREKMIDFCKSEMDAKVKCELGTYGFTGTVGDDRFFIRCHEIPRGDECDYYVMVYSITKLVNINTPPPTITNAGKVSCRVEYEKRKPNTTDWKAIGIKMRETGLSYGQLQVRGML